MTRLRAAAAAGAAVLSLSACGTPIVPDIPDSGIVVRRGECAIKPCHPRKYLTVRDEHGVEYTFRVRKPIHDACPPGSRWPACKENHS